ncbi:mitochondrial transcription termination factor [Haematococcus lacustris]|uniref:Mitochondrial transcription termination factor n=1 Tax=Haematococcus lacustris TaxID=44745 RepID=A0A699Z508_HAELA|nr:mitochondrial transcription termination factor [Haematococcus lacustris]
MNSWTLRRLGVGAAGTLGAVAATAPAASARAPPVQLYLFNAYRADEIALAAQDLAAMFDAKEAVRAARPSAVVVEEVPSSHTPLSQEGSSVSSEGECADEVIQSTFLTARPGQAASSGGQGQMHELLRLTSKLLCSPGLQREVVKVMMEDEEVRELMLRQTQMRNLDAYLQAITYLTSIGLRQDEVCNMASISVVLLGLNPETRIKPVVEYLQRRGMPDESIPDLVLKHPRIFEYRLESSDASSLCKGRARIQVDVLPIGPNGSKVAAVNYFRDNATFLESPVSPVPPSPTPALLT